MIKLVLMLKVILEFTRILWISSRKGASWEMKESISFTRASLFSSLAIRRLVKVSLSGTSFRAICTNHYIDFCLYKTTMAIRLDAKKNKAERDQYDPLQLFCYT